MPSSVIARFRYQPSVRALEVVFKSGRTYIYRNVPAAVAEDMKAEFSKGEYFNAHIRGQFAFERRKESAPARQDDTFQQPSDTSD